VRQHGSLEVAVAGGIHLVAAAHQIDRALQPAAKDNDAVDLLRCRIGPSEAVFERFEQALAERRPRCRAEDEEHSRNRRDRQPSPAKRRRDQPGQQQEDGEIQRLDEEPEDLREVEEHACPSLESRLELVTDSPSLEADGGNPH
jgi:hypothetical protein